MENPIIAAGQTAGIKKPAAENGGATDLPCGHICIGNTTFPAGGSRCACPSLDVPHIFGRLKIFVHAASGYGGDTRIWHQTVFIWII
ncbi:hypothetical protein V9W64_03285 [Neisseria leonii]|uniref:Uncharacterized protein n=1 Tax=Neisseria leonii TaxID=2995413 RepID=A0A9X4IBG9_9NEIS|nr:hypothetical protein [Neisseria sp. 51.81]MDD9328374.1 hypothetical protein [Neisseria sp. 51.81]